MFGLSFLFPAILIAAAAVAAPVLIHLLMRPRPRHVIFPAMRFVVRSHLASIRRTRLRHWLLLMLRAALIVTLAVLIARPQIQRWRVQVDTSRPAAAVFVLDNSGSMNCLYGGRSALQAAKQLAGEILAGLPSGSRAAVMSTGEAAPRSLSQDPKLVAQQIADVEEGFGAVGLAGTIARAAELLAASDLPRKEIYVLTDMTGEAWREGEAAAPAESVNVTLLDCGGEPPGNVAIESLRLSEQNAPSGVEVTVEAALASRSAACDALVEAELDGKAVGQKAARVPAGGLATVSLGVRPQRTGTLHGRLRIRHGDALEMDDTRYFTLHVVPPAELLIVREASLIGAGGQVSFLMGLAAASGGDEADSWVRRRTITSEGLTDEAVRAADIVMLADVAGLDEGQWRLIEQRVRAGGSLWVVAGPLMSADGYAAAAAQRLLPAAVGELEQLAAPTGWEPAARGNSMLQPFEGEANPPLAAVKCWRRRAVASLAADAEVVLRYADGAPAIVDRKVGAGRAVLWNFSPTSDFSNLAGLEQFPILAQRTVRLLARGEAPPPDVLWGSAVVIPVPADMPAAVAAIRRPGLAVEQTVAPDMRSAAVPLLADRLGGWTVKFVEGNRVVETGFAVNVDPRESDLARMTDAEVAALLGGRGVLVARDAGELTRRRSLVRRPLDLTAPALLLALALLTAESLLANRFYRNAGDGGAASA